MATPLDYETPPRNNNGRVTIIFPFLPLIFLVLEFPWAFFCFITEAGNMGDQHAMRPAQLAEINSMFTIAFVPAFLGLIAGLFVLIRIRKYGLAARYCAILGTILCATLLAFVFLR
jgi:hypothetical protein